MTRTHHESLQTHPAGSRAVWLRTLAIGLAAGGGAAVALLQLHVIATLGIDVPVWEHWVFLPILDAVYAGRPWLGSTFQLFFDHVIAVPMLVFIGLSRLNGWDVKFEMYWGWFLVTATCVLMARWVRRLQFPLPIKSLLFVCLVLLVYGLRASELVLNGLNSTIFHAYFFLAVALELAREQKDSLARVGAAAGVGMLATWSWGAGVLVWPAGALLLLHHERRRWVKLAVWGFMALGAAVPFLVGRVGSKASHTEHDLSRIPRWLLEMVSSPFSLHARLLPAALLLLLLLATLGVLLWRFPRWRGVPAEGLPWAGLVAHGFCTMLLVLYLRSPSPLFLAHQSRYTYVAAFFIVGLLPLALLALREVTQGAPRWVRGGAWGAAALVLVLIGAISARTSYRVYEQVSGWHPIRGKLEAFMLRTPEHATEGQFLGVVQLEYGLVREGLEIMRRWGLGPYRHSAGAGAPVRLEERLGGPQAPDVDLAVVSPSVVNGDLHLSGWAVDRQGSRPAAFVMAVAEGAILEQALTEFVYPMPPGLESPQATYGWRIGLPAAKLRALASLERLELIALTADGRLRRIPLPLPEELRLAARPQ